ncbi:MAG: ATP-binding protein [bacterium]
MVITVASGKGGTGKTTVAVSLALATGCQYLDCDVEEPNGHVFLKPEIARRTAVEKLVPEVDLDRCSFCHECSRACAYHALAVLKDQVLTFPELCHSCGLCAWVCPERAISEKGIPIGAVEAGFAGAVGFVQGRLNVGEPMAVPVIRAVKKEIHTEPGAILDAPPGSSCPVVQSVLGSDYCLLVTEPTPFGLYDLKLAVEMVRRLGVRFGVVLNRCDIGDDRTGDWCRAEGIPILMRIPHDRQVAEGGSRGVPLVESRPGYRAEFVELWQRIRETVA